MVGKDISKVSYRLDQVLTESQINNIIEQSIECDVSWQLIDSEVKRAMEGLTGFLGEHIRVTLNVKVGDNTRKVYLFVKRMPVDNKPKAEFIDHNNYFKREKLMFKLLEEMEGAEGPNPWCPRAFIYTDSLIVMPDLAAEGYVVRPLLETLDLPHAIFAVATIARFHAAFANYERQKTVDVGRPYNSFQEYGHLLSEPTFCNSTWLRTAAKLTAGFLNTFSKKYNKNVNDLELKLTKAYLEACDSLTVREDTLNVMLHKDLWVNNILFNYDQNELKNAILVDYQCIRYGPPAFDLMTFLYLNTTRSFRDQHEREILQYYFSIFSKALDTRTKQKLDSIDYDENDLLSWCERSRMFGIFEAIGIFPVVLMDPTTAEEVFDDPETYMKYMSEDRLEPVVAYSKKCPSYKERQLEVSEEFVERYILK